MIPNYKMQKLKFIQKPLILVALIGMVYLGWQVGKDIWIEIVINRLISFSEVEVDSPLHSGGSFSDPITLTPEIIDQLKQFRDP